MLSFHLWDACARLFVYIGLLLLHQISAIDYSQATDSYYGGCVCVCTLTGAKHSSNTMKLNSGLWLPYIHSHLSWAQNVRKLNCCKSLFAFNRSSLGQYNYIDITRLIPLQACFWKWFHESLNSILVSFSQLERIDQELNGLARSHPNLQLHFTHTRTHARYANDIRI